MSRNETSLDPSWNLDRWADRLKLAALFFAASLIVIAVSNTLQVSSG